MALSTSRQQQANQKKERILEAALRVFSSKGLDGASNKDIAQEAGIASPGLIYHYFKDKNDLFFNVLESFAPLAEIGSISKKLRGQPPDAALEYIARRYLEIGENPLYCSAVRLFMGEALRNEKLAKIVGKLAPDRIIESLKEYFDDQMERGNMRKADSRSLAICFMGPLLARLVGDKLLHAETFVQIDSEEFVKTHVGIFLNGVKPV